MNDAPFPYQPLPGKLRGWIRKSSLWEGSDHLLLIRGTRFTEEYRRFYYRDIAAITSRRCIRFGSFGWLSLLAIAFLISLVASAIPNFRPLAALLGTGLFAYTFIAIRFGCRCFLQTAVSREELPSLYRTGKAEASLARLRTRIAEAQGVLTQDEVDTLASSRPQPSGLFAPSNPPEARTTARPISLALIALVLCLVDAAYTFPQLSGRSLFNNVLSGRLLQVLYGFLILLIGAAALGSILTSLRIRALNVLRFLMIAVLGVCSFDVTVSNLLQTPPNNLTVLLPNLKHSLIAIDFALWLILGIGGLSFVLLTWNNLRRGDVFLR